jgi:DNA-binding transcriptional LysR family regulator
MDNRAGEMQVFLRVVDTGSFSQAARALLMTPSTVSKLIARIEARIGVRLIERSTRRLSLTAEGLLRARPDAAGGPGRPRQPVDARRR